MKWLKSLTLLLIIFVFIYLRITPIINQTVPYTYDQGRDFLKIEEIFRDKNITFIGPTTGIQGVYHGVWWYYFLIVPYLTFSGWPLGFYFFLFFVNFLVNLGFFSFIKEKYGFATGVFFLSLVSVSTFFIRTAFFASNNILAPLAVMFFIYSLYQAFQTKEKKYFIFIGLSLGMIFETEMAFGLFIIPSFFIVYLISKKLENLPFIIAGLILPSIPRIFFELKNNFSQSRSFLSYIFSGKKEHPVEFLGLIQERITTFWESWKSIFYQENHYMAIFFILFLIVLFLNRKSDKIKTAVAKFLVSIFLCVFIISLLNKNSFFWSYYIDGIQYIFIFLIIYAFYLIEKNNKTKIIAYILLTIIIFLNIITFIKETGNKEIPTIGLRADDKIVKYILKKNQNKSFCLKIYTPPVFPFTYRYLFEYYTKKYSIDYPKDQPINKQCWYIIDFDEDKERIKDWTKKNIPDGSRKVEKKVMENKTNIELWQLPY